MDPVGCPACGTPSGRVHSRYQRRLSDTSITGREVLIELRSAGCSVTTSIAAKQLSPSRYRGWRPGTLAGH
ncbi:transposase family protein [Nocardia sp. Marseille-Q1738]